MTIKKEDGAKRLVLRRGGDLLSIGEIGDELPDFGDAHFPWMAFVVKEDIVSDPEEVGFFGAGGVVFDAKGVAVLVEEFSRGKGGWRHFVAFAVCGE